MSSAIVTGSEYLALPRAPETWLVEGLLPTGGGLLLYGDPKVGKSFAALQLACCVTSGVEWLGFAVPQPTKVVYVQLDTPRTLWADRVQTLAESGYPVEGIHFADRETLGTHPFDILNPEHFKLLATSLAEINPGAVILDTLRESHSGDENDSTEMQEVISHIEAAVKPAAMVIIAHAKKPSQDGAWSLMNDNRGSSYIVGRMDAIVRFSQASMRCSSRTMEEHTIKLDRNDDGMWSVAVDAFVAEAELILQNYPGRPLRELARMLHDRTEKSESACRAWLRRHIRPTKKGGWAAV